MSLLHTPAISEPLIAPDFALKNIDNKIMHFNDVKGKNGTVLAFICNHCPYVKAIITRFVADARILQNNGIGIACIMPNDSEQYPADNFENMQKFAKQHNFTFPYLIDETQKTAKSYNAICTPDIFGFNAQNKLKYRGRLDSAGPNPADQNTNKELLNAMQEIANTGDTSAAQFSSMGCSIKWK